MPLTRLASEASSLVAGSAMAALAAARRGKAVHPFGVVHRATVRVHGGPDAPAGSELLRRPGEHEAIVRLSRSIGLPRPLPDLLMVTSIDRPVLHHVFVPAGDPQQRVYSSSLPYEAGGEHFLVGVLPGGAPGRFRLAVAPLEGRFAAVADIELGERLPEVADALRFNPWNTGGGLQPSGMLNRWRRRAYPMSQAAWARTREGADVAQRAADRVAAPLP